MFLFALPFTCYVPCASTVNNVMWLLRCGSVFRGFVDWRAMPCIIMLPRSEPRTMPVAGSFFRPTVRRALFGSIKLLRRYSPVSNSIEIVISKLKMHLRRCGTRPISLTLADICSGYLATKGSKKLSDLFRSSFGGFSRLASPLGQRQSFPLLKFGFFRFRAMNAVTITPKRTPSTRDELTAMTIPFT